MKPNEHRQLLMRELTNVGIKPSWEVTGANHIRIMWRYPNGQPDSLIVAATPSDHRSTLNSRARIRRKLKDFGILNNPTPVGALSKAMSLPDPDQLSLLERVDLLERDVAALLDLLADQYKKPAVALTQQVARDTSAESGWVLHHLTVHKFMRVNDIAKSSGRNYYTVYSALRAAEKRGLVERNDRKEWRIVDRERSGTGPHQRRYSEAAAG